MKGLWPKDMPVEVYFLKYAFPCAFITLQRGRITRAEFEMLERGAIGGEGTGRLVAKCGDDAKVKYPAVLRADLERIFAPAMRRLKKLAAETGYAMWSRELIEEYYFKNHNKIIDEGEGDYCKAPAVLRELCKIFPAKVVSFGSVEGAAVVKLPGGKLRAVNTLITGPLKKGDHVMVHYGYACEKLAD